MKPGYSHLFLVISNPSLYIVCFCSSCLYCSNLSFILLTILLTSLCSEKPNHKSFFPVRLPFSAAVIIFYQYAFPVTQAIIIILASLTCSIFHLTSSLGTILAPECGHFIISFLCASNSLILFLYSFTVSPLYLMAF